MRVLLRGNCIPILSKNRKTHWKSQKTKLNIYENFPNHIFIQQTLWTN